ncbi:MAG TPA: ribosomal-processing cysteine protease Prp [Acetivibrio clariflavus]|nr:ribosomal-processing cysteine protease Prp [Acetivibrio clariflavus]
MITVNIVRDKSGFIWQYIVDGHAGYDEAGKDIICAAVTAVAYTGINALMELAGIKSYGLENGYMICSVPTDISPELKKKVSIILETVAVGFKQLELSYGDYVTVLDEEV